MNEKYFIDDRPLDLSKFDGLSKEELDEVIQYFEQQEAKRKERCKHMTKEEQYQERLRADQEDDKWLSDFCKKKQLTA